MVGVNFQNIKSVYFIGIGGISMSGLAMVLKNRGYDVSGSDSKNTDITENLTESGINVFIGQSAENIKDGIEMAVYSAAISPENPEMLEAERKGIPLIPRSKLLGIIMDKFEKSVAIAGTHGKTTTTAMVSQILISASLDPTISIGGILPVINSNIRIGHSDYFITEACEYTNSFLELVPAVAVVLNIELDHIDYFKSMDEVYESFKGFASNVKDGGAVIINSDIEGYENIAGNKKIITYGLGDGCCWRAGSICYGSDSTEFDLFYENRLVGRAALPLPGLHNVSNTLAACATAHFLGVPEDKILEAVKTFTGAKRRFELKGIKNGISVYDDYAHHPSEIKATLSAARSRSGKGKIWCVFQPHTFSRTRAFLDEFSKSFEDADEVILADIYAAREKDSKDINSQMLLDKIKLSNKPAVYIPCFNEIAEYLDESCRDGDMVITMGAGDIYLAGEMLLKR